jgi:penicillin-binding protein A
VAEVPLRRARAAWIEGDLAHAQRLLERRSPLGIRRTARHHALAAVLMARGDTRRAAVLLQEKTRFPLLSTEEVGRRLLQLGRNLEFLQYEASARSGSAEAVLYKASALLNLGRLEESEATAARLDPAQLEQQTWGSFRAALEERRRGSYTFLRDRTGEPLASLSVKDGDLAALDGSSASWIDRSGGEFTVEAQLERIGTGFTFDTTIQLEVQRAASASLAGHSGSLVAIDVRTGEVLAVANSSRRNRAFTADQEPGAVLHPLTLAASIDAGADPQMLFPMHCDGFLILGGQHLYDWGRHERVDDLEEAMAVSCNVAFGRIGLNLGAAKLGQALASFGFGSPVDTGLVVAPLGRIVGGLAGEHAVASAAVGQERIATSPLHLAAIAVAIANGGEFIEPRLVLRRRTVLGDTLSPGAPFRRRAASAAAVQRVTGAMKGVVTHERGTGRLAAVEGLPMAVKTGISGSASRGYDNVVIAFAPAGAPRIAIGMVVENAGPDPFAGARVAQNFFRAIAANLGL